MLQKDGGEIFINGVKVEIASPSFAIKNSIGMVPQELNVVPEISIAENICMGTQSRKAGFLLDWKDIYKKAKKIMAQLGLTMDPRKIVGICSVAQLQMVQIGRALAFGAKIIILDEPTSSLTYHEKITLFEVMRQLKANGVGLVFITHHLDEVKEISDRVTVMQDGERIDTTYVKDTSIREIITKMVGHNVVFSKFNRNFEGNDVILEVKDLCHKTDYRNVSFKIKRGEIFGVAGLVGAGRTELMLTIFGSNPAESGSIFFNGKEVSIKSPKEAIGLGIGYLPEERRTQGIFPEMSVCENLTVLILRRLCKHGVVDRKEQNEITRKYIREYDIKTPSIEKQIRDLSGGNQQKVIFARWIEKDVDLLILDESTRGIDVSTKEEIHKLIERLAQKGKTIVVVSSEDKELLNVSDRIMVMNEGEIKGILNAHETSKQDILSLALG